MDADNKLITILNAVQEASIYTECSEVLSLVDIFRNHEVEFGFSLQNVKTVFE